MDIPLRSTVNVMKDILEMTALFRILFEEIVPEIINLCSRHFPLKAQYIKLSDQGYIQQHSQLIDL
uniref:DHC_N1 domain-containing protein n=1 Tax=Heterorhabditis bacteriophora TaxID=37862 RepID=A0A1I7XD97_HETBA